MDTITCYPNFRTFADCRGPRNENGSIGASGELSYRGFVGLLVDLDIKSAENRYLEELFKTTSDWAVHFWKTYQITSNKLGGGWCANQKGIGDLSIRLPKST